PLSLGLIGLTEAIPSISIALYGGHLADKVNRKKIILFFIVILLAASLFLFLFSADEHQNFLRYGTLPVYVVIFLIGIGGGFLAPAITSFGAQLVPREIYANASAWNSSVWQLGAVTGPAIGGIVYGLRGAAVSTALVCIFTLFSIICYLFIASKP